MYNHIIIGGTFDGLHKGHVHILAHAFDKGARVTIGLTSEAYIRRYKKGQGVRPMSRRYSALTAWLRKNHVAERTTIVPLDNRWGPSILGEFDAIVVTPDNRHVAQEINTLRSERGLAALEVLTVDLIPAEDQKPISTTRIRKGEIDYTGHLTLPDSLRPELQKPLGRVLIGEDIKREVMKNKDNIVVAVGDVTTETLFLCGVRPALAIIDLRVKRSPYRSLEAFQFPKYYEIVRVVSGPGYISRPAVEAIRAWSGQVRKRKRVVLVINGEEDLLALPAIVHAPIGSVIYYGQPAQGDRIFGTQIEGLVEVNVTAEKKKEILELLDKFN
jgi:pantetheine-phosphate adenylyltransferase